MKFNKGLIIQFMVLGLGLVGCGEAFQGTFRGDASVFRSSCGGQIDPAGYNLEVRAQVSGSDFSIDVTSLTRKSDSLPDAIMSSYLTRVSGSSGLSGSTAFGKVDEQLSEGELVSFSGTISTARDQIDNLVIDYRGQKADGSACQILVQSRSSLTLVQ